MRNNQDRKNNTQSSNPDPGPVFYEIKIQGQLDPQRSRWFEGMALTYHENDENGMPCTRISGLVIDQPALHGLLTKIRDLNLTLISVRRFIPRKVRLRRFRFNKRVLKPHINTDSHSEKTRN